MEWKDFPSKPWVAWAGLFSFVWGIPGMLTDGADWARWATMNPALSAYLMGVGSSLLLLFVVANISQLRQQDEPVLQAMRRWVAARTTGRTWRQAFLSACLGISIASFLFWVLGFFVSPPDMERESPPRPLTEEEQFVKGTMGRPLTEIERERRRIKPTSEEESALSFMHTLLPMVEGWDMKHPGWLDDRSWTFDLAKYLTKLELAPTSGYERKTEDVAAFAPTEWRDYLPFIIPYLEKYGMTRALHETRRYNATAFPDLRQTE